MTGALKVLIANRGEIACRIIRSCKAMGFACVAIYSDADETAQHVQLADEALHIGGPRPADSYLLSEKILDAARRSGATAIHPGYGFLAENATFAQAVIDAGYAWLGPDPETIEAMADKQRARHRAIAAGVPVLPASERLKPKDEEGWLAAAASVKYPLIVKAAGGGGGIGMKRVDSPDLLVKTVAATISMAERAFANPDVFLERYVPEARHIEIQVFGFGDGRVVHGFERDCSAQRRFQKIVEEAPAPGVKPELRATMASSAVALAKAERYRGAGTIEFLFDESRGEFYFLEMNTRIQVEHPVTEMITGLDIVGLQLRLASGDQLDDLIQDNITCNGHAIECRLYAEDPAKQFLPSPGLLEKLKFPPESASVRIDSGLVEGDRVTPYYDPMIAKIIVHAADRQAAISLCLSAIEDTEIAGIANNLDFLRALVGSEAFREHRIHTNFVEQNLGEMTNESRRSTSKKEPT